MQKSKWLLLFSIVFLSCQKELIVPDLGHDYYPLSIGFYRIYDVEETTYLFKVATIEHYQIRETIIDEIGTGDESVFLLRIEKRTSETESWEAIGSAYVRQTNAFLEYREGNVPIVSMSYPVKMGRSWNANTLNNDPEAMYYYSEVGVPTTEADEIKIVISDLPPNIVEQDQRYEIYARGIGLVERSFTTIEFCQTGCEGQTNLPDNGRILLQQLKGYGTL